MSASHKLQITFDTATGELRAVHRTTVTVGGQAVSHAEDVGLGEGVATEMRLMIEQNAEAMESAATSAAVRHAAATSNGPAAKRLKAGGSLGAAGNVK